MIAELQSRLPGFVGGGSALRGRVSRALLAVVLLGTGCGVAGGGTYFAPVAAVACSAPKKCEEIKEADIASTLRTVLAQPGSGRTFGGPQGEANKLQAKREILTGLIREAVVRQQAAGLKIKLTDREVNNTLDIVRRRMQGQGDFDKALAEQGLTSDELDRLARNQLLFQKVRDSITGKVKPPEKQVVDFYNANKATFDGKIKISHILVCSDLDLEQFLCNAGPQDQALAGQVATRAKNGEDFAALAKEFSKDRQTAGRGGELGYVGRGELAKAFEDAAFALANPGDISDPVKTQFGYHVIRLLGRGESIESARESIQEVLSQELRRRELNKWIAGVVAKATVKVNPKFGRFDPSSLSVVPLKIQIPDMPAQNRSPAQNRPPAQNSPPAP